MAHDEEIIPGVFWLPENPDKTVYGRLHLSDDVRLELEGSITSAMEYQEQTDAEGNVSIMGSMGEELDAFTVLGELRDRQSAVSLFECTTVGRSGDWFMSDDSAQTVVPAYGLRGGHVDHPSGFTGMRAELQHLEVWSQAAGFTMVMHKGGKCTLTYEEPAESDNATLDNGAPVEKEKAKEIRAQTKKDLAAAGFSEDEVKAAIDALASISRPSYKKRLAKLREHVLDIAPELFGSNFKEWSKEVTNCRNDLAHNNVGVITPEATGVYAAVIYSLRWLLLVALLLETGVSRQVLREKLIALQAYRLFVQQAPGMLPSVYGEDDADTSGS